MIAATSLRVRCLAAIAFALAPACTLGDPDGPLTPVGGGSGTPTGPQAPDPTPDTPELDNGAPPPVQLPPNWTGSGVLALAHGVPAGAPDWSAVRAEIRVEEGGRRYLYASACATRIQHPPLAVAAAENRARAELARWLGTEHLVGSEIATGWRGPDHAVCSQARIVIPEQWQPGDPAPQAPAQPTPP